THDMHGARAVSDRIALMKDGQVLIQGTFDDLRKSQDQFVKQFLNGSEEETMFTAFRVGVLIFLALVILSIGVFLIGNQSLLFSSTYILKCNFQNVMGLNNGAEVRIGGIHEGTVKQIQLPAQPGGQMTVVMDLRNPTRSVIKKDSVASIKT